MTVLKINILKALLIPLTQKMSALSTLARNIVSSVLKGDHVPKFKKIWLDFHNRCNYDCIFCNVHKITPQTLRLQDFKSFDEILPLADEFDITGYGEFLTHPDAREIINKLSDANKKFTLVSNGFLLTKENINLLDKSTLSSLSISLNSLNDSNYKKLTGKDIAPVLTNIEYIFSKQRSFNVRFTFVITSYNIDEMNSFIKFGKKHNSHITFYGLIPTIKDYPYGLQLANTDENRKKLEDAIVYAKEIGVELLPFDFNASRDDSGNMFDESTVDLSEKIKKCPVVYNDVFISTAGDVTPCCYLQNKMGNIKEKTLIDIWHGKEYKELRASIAKGDLKYCRNCRMFG